MAEKGLADMREASITEQGLKSMIDNIPGGVGIYRIYPDDRMELKYMNDGYYYLIDATRVSRSQYQGFDAATSVHPQDQKIGRASCRERV